MGGAVDPQKAGFMVVGAHTDSPCPKLKPVSTLEKDGHVMVRKLSRIQEVCPAEHVHVNPSRLKITIVLLIYTLLPHASLPARRPYSPIGECGGLRGRHLALVV